MNTIAEKEIGIIPVEKKKFSRNFILILKTISWRIIAVIITIAVCYIYNKDISLSVTLGISLNVIKALFYYLHEKLWENY